MAAPVGTRIATTFGLRDVAVALPVAIAADTLPTYYDLPSVESAAFKLNVSELDQWGDDILQNVWYHSQKGVITVKHNKLSLQIFELISGNLTTSSSTMQRMLFGTDLELLPPFVTVRAKIPYRNEVTLLPGLLTVYWYKCSVKTAWENFPGSERAKIGDQTIMFNTFSSGYDHKGNVVSQGGAASAFGHFEFDL